MDSNTTSERTYLGSSRGLRPGLATSDPSAQDPGRPSRGEAAIVITLASLTLWALIVAAIWSLASALFA